MRAIVMCQKMEPNEMNIHSPFGYSGISF